MNRIRQLFKFEPASGLLMIAAMVLALVSANSPLQPTYELVHHTPVHFRFGPFVIDKPLVDWINQGLMVFFFLLVGLEIKRQAVEGRLSTPAQIALPGLAALGGMVVPSLIYILFNRDDTARLQGWAIPTATDIVLALGILSLLGRRVPVGLKVFLTALAIFDDIGAILIIGLFYGETLSPTPLLLLLLAVIALLLLNAYRVTRVTPYALVGLFLWLAMQRSGIHPTLAGIFIAFAVPMRAPGCRCASPLREVERRLHPWVTLGLVPLFAFFNSGISLDSVTPSSLFGPVSLGVVLGLFLGKQIGVFGAAWLSLKLGWAQPPAQSTLPHIYGAAVLAGIGFTMSLFITSLAFDDAETAASAKAAVLFGSILSALLGLAVLAISTKHSGKTHERQFATGTRPSH